MVTAIRAELNKCFKENEEMKQQIELLEEAKSIHHIPLSDKATEEKLQKIIEENNNFRDTNKSLFQATDEFRAEIEDLKQQLTVSTTETIGDISEISGLQKENAKLKENNESQAACIGQFKIDHDVLEATIDECKDLLVQEQKKVIELQTENSNLHVQLEESTKKSEEVLQAYHKYSEENRTFRKQVQALSDQLKELTTP